MGVKPSGVKMPPREWFWEHQHLTYARMAMRWGDVTESQIKSCGRDLLFRRPLREADSYEKGPCVRCNTQYEHRKLDSKFRCAACAKTVAEEEANRPRTPQELRDEAHRQLFRDELKKRPHLLAAAHHA